ncbi:MAG: twin-arginine translocase TatA/TatE family subunit [Ignavibacteriales bacterium]|nr:twin-arginine translocase TatA/TatE family subunit [Ignavibacteriales bacterium]
MGNLGAGEILLIVLVVLILFGSKKIPELAQGIGKGMREFKKALNDVQEDIKITDKPESKEEKK